MRLLLTVMINMIFISPKKFTKSSAQNLMHGQNEDRAVVSMDDCTSWYIIDH